MRRLPDSGHSWPMPEMSIQPRTAREHAVHQWARAQHGIITREQCRSAGISPRMERTRIAQGAWARRGRALVIHEFVVPGDRHEAWLLQAEAGPHATVSGPLAARLGGWQIDGSERIVVMTEHDRSMPPGVRVLRRNNPAWPISPTGLRLAKPIDALADTAVCRSMAQARALIDMALQRRWFTSDEFDELIGHRAGHGRRGVGRLRALRQRVVSGSRSEAEQRMAVLLRRSATGRWRANHPLLDGAGRVVAEIDFALLPCRIAIEVDGRAFHSDRHSFERDRQRQNLLVLGGWTVLRFTWEQIHDDADGVIATVQSAIVAAKPNSG